MIAIVNGTGSVTTVLQSFNTTSGDQTFNGVISGNGIYSCTDHQPRYRWQHRHERRQYLRSGGTQLNDGTLILGVDSVHVSPASGPLGTGTVNIRNTFGNLQASGGSRTLSNAIAFAGSGTPGSASPDPTTSRSPAAALTSEHRRTPSGWTAPAVRRSRASSPAVRAAALTKSGNGTLTVAAAPSYTGATTVSVGTRSSSRPTTSAPPPVTSNTLLQLAHSATNNVVLKTGSVTVTGQIDLTNNKLVVGTAPALRRRRLRPGPAVTPSAAYPSGTAPPALSPAKATHSPV